MDRLTQELVESLSSAFVGTVDENGRPWVLQRQGKAALPTATNEPRADRRLPDPASIPSSSSTLSREDAAQLADCDFVYVAHRSDPASGVQSKPMDLSLLAGDTGFLVVAHESELLIPDYADESRFITGGEDHPMGMLSVARETGRIVQLTGTYTVLNESYHVGRFPGAVRVLCCKILAALDAESYAPIRLSQAIRERPRQDVVEWPTPKPGELSASAVLSINVSMPRDVDNRGKRVATGIFKEPVEGRVQVRRLNLVGDGQADRWGHGGSFRAIYVYPASHYDHWRDELDRTDLAPGFFGENLTVSEMLEDDVRIGDVLKLGSAVVEVSQPRIPCFKLDLKVGIEGFQKRFLRSGRVGFYLRVLSEGEIGVGDAFELLRRDPAGLSVRSVSDLLFFNTDDRVQTRRALAIRALAHGWKGSFEERLKQATATPDPFQELVVSKKVKESEMITSIYLEDPSSRPLPAFTAGQFLTLELDISECQGTITRTYSLSDSPGSDHYRISVKRELPPPNAPDVPPGLSSSYLHDRVDVGDRLRVAAPRGSFVLKTSSPRAKVLLSAGVGITPLMSMLKSLARSDSSRPVWFVHGARNRRQHAFGGEVRSLAAAGSNIRAHIRYSAPEPSDQLGRDYDSVGRIDVDLLKSLLPFDDYEFYLVGPSGFMHDLYRGLCGTGVRPDRIHYEFFGPATVLRDPKAENPGGQKVVDDAHEVVFARAGVATRWDPTCSSLLELAEREGLAPPFSCRSGICRTCESVLSEGEVSYREAPLNRPREGSVLLCVARPEGRVIVDI